MASTVEQFEGTIKHVWSEPKALAALEVPFGSHIDLDWWEPRYDQPWRRQVARDRDAFGGAHVAAPQPPVEGPNNPNRLRRELEYAEDDRRRAESISEDAGQELAEASARIKELRERLERA